MTIGFEFLSAFGLRESFRAKLYPTSNVTHVLFENIIVIIISYY